jgi:hypothetical protein
MVIEVAAKKGFLKRDSPEDFDGRQDENGHVCTGLYARACERNARIETSYWVSGMREEVELLCQDPRVGAWTRRRSLSSGIRELINAFVSVAERRRLARKQRLIPKIGVPHDKVVQGTIFWAPDPLTEPRIYL